MFIILIKVRGNKFMGKFIKIFGIVVVALSINMCAFLPTPPSVCDTAPEDSYICAKAGELGVQVEDIDLLLQTAAFYVLKDKDKEKVLKFYIAIEKILNGDITYQLLMKIVLEKVDAAGPEVMLAARYIRMLDVNNLISDFDKNLILIHIEHQKDLLNSID